MGHHGMQTSVQIGSIFGANQQVKFLDPFTKSGVFLREITSRLTQGLEQEIPNLEQRVNHILTKQVFGIGIMNLALRGIEADFGPENTDTFRRDLSIPSPSPTHFLKAA